MNIFIEAHTLVRSIEAHIVSDKKSGNFLFDGLKRFFWHPTVFLKIGVLKKLKDASILAFLTSVFSGAGAWLVHYLGIEKSPHANLIMLAAMTAPVIFVVFPMPSIYGDFGVEPKLIEFVEKHLKERGFANKESIELLWKSVGLFEDRARLRVGALKWLVGILWAGFVYSFAKGFEPTTYSPSELGAHFLMSIWLFMGVGGAYLFVWGYEASINKLFRAIEFGCNEFCHQFVL